MSLRAPVDPLHHGRLEKREPGFTCVGYGHVQVEGASPAHIVSLSSDFLTDDRLNRIPALIGQAVLSNSALATKPGSAWREPVCAADRRHYTFLKRKQCRKFIARP